MGQAQSDDHRCDQDDSTMDVANYEINSARKQDGDEFRKQSKQQQASRCRAARLTISKDQQQQHVRKLSNVSNRNIQLLSMKPRSEKDAYADNLRSRRRSSLINLILGAPSSGPRFSDDLCSLSSHISECNFGIEFFPDIYHTNTSVSSLRLESSLEDVERGGDSSKVSIPDKQPPTSQKRRRSSLGSQAVAAISSVIKGEQMTGKEPQGAGGGEPAGGGENGLGKQDKKLALSAIGHQGRYQQFRKPSLTSTLASIDLTSSFEQHDKSNALYRPPLYKTKQTIFESAPSPIGTPDLKTRASRGRVNQGGRILRRSGSELSLYSTVSACSSQYSLPDKNKVSSNGASAAGLKQHDLRSETKLIIILQVCLPFILAGFGNMGAGLVLNRVAEWEAFKNVPIFFVLLPPFIGLKGNIEMTLASRLSTLSNLNLLDTGRQRLRAYESNLVLILSQAIGLSVFATLVSTICEFLVGGMKLDSSAEILELLETSVLVVLVSALVTSIILVFISSIIVSLSIGLANLIQVNPDNLSTLIAALYGDISCVLVYGFVAEWMYSLREQNVLVFPIVTIICAMVGWPILLFSAYKFKETHRIAISSIPPMMASIMVSIGSGAVLSLIVGRFKLIALYQPVVNGFGANLIAVQASRVSTWLWCSALRKASIESNSMLPAAKTLDSLASFTMPVIVHQDHEDELKAAENGKSLQKKIFKLIRTPLWSFLNPSPNSVAARLLLIMLIPAHTIYFFVIWLLAPVGHVTLTWQFYFAYVLLCVIQGFILLTICEPLMTLLMRRNLDPDIFGISLLMALADLIGTLCLTGAFFSLAAMGDPNSQ